MEDRTTTDATLRIYNELQPKYGNLGVVFQAYMRRTLADIDSIAQEPANVRLCKGIYLEPREIAYTDAELIRLYSKSRISLGFLEAHENHDPGNGLIHDFLTH